MLLQGPPHGLHQIVVLVYSHRLEVVLPLRCKLLDRGQGPLNDDTALCGSGLDVVHEKRVECFAARGEPAGEQAGILHLDELLELVAPLRELDAAALVDLAELQIGRFDILLVLPCEFLVPALALLRDETLAFGCLLEFSLCSLLCFLRFLLCFLLCLDLSLGIELHPETYFHATNHRSTARPLLVSGD
ncbi:hypothetical protein DAT35_37585 [Vitiosangium sp. GDMCC 1.1324]|nr:hypothetical protein DAT35_37585 [Vitiosangium sp. GDMCC 1.1324]